jgi:hypothetical protein
MKSKNPCMTEDGIGSDKLFGHELKSPQPHNLNRRRMLRLVEAHSPSTG